jgi:hypothetical protein
MFVYCENNTHAAATNIDYLRFGIEFRERGKLEEHNHTLKFLPPKT